MTKPTKDEQQILDWLASQRGAMLALLEALVAKGAKVQAAGDCVAPRLIEDNLAEAFLLAQTL